MPVSQQRVIYTIGHSTRTFDAFITLLTSFKIELLADVRSYPGSKRYPYFNKENLQQHLPEHAIKYQHLPELGGRRKALKDSKNIVWKNDAFRGYADYMDTEAFKEGITVLQDIGSQYTTAYMCSEAVWWRCHRSLISDYLKWKGWEVMHIMGENKSEEHPYTSPAQIVNEQLVYADNDQPTLF